MFCADDRVKTDTEKMPCEDGEKIRVGKPRKAKDCWQPPGKSMEQICPQNPPKESALLTHWYWISGYSVCGTLLWHSEETNTPAVVDVKNK